MGGRKYAPRGAEERPPRRLLRAGAGCDRWCPAVIPCPHAGGGAGEGPPGRPRREYEATRGRRPFRDWLATWLEARRPDLRPQAWRQYEIHARVWLVPVLGDVRLDELRREHWDRLVSAMTEATGHGGGHPHAQPDHGQAREPDPPHRSSSRRPPWCPRGGTAGDDARPEAGGDPHRDPHPRGGGQASRGCGRGAVWSRLRPGGHGRASRGRAPRAALG